MGKGEGYTLHPGTMTFRDAAGVCKDIAGMLVTMLRAAGYEAYGAMTMAGARVEDIPADQFNHCVVALKKPDGSFQMLDPTWAPWNNPTWSRWEGEQDYVIGTFEGEDLMQIPSFSAEDNLLSVTSEARLAADGALEGSFVFTGAAPATGACARRRRSADARPQAFLENWLGALSPRPSWWTLLQRPPRLHPRQPRCACANRLPGWPRISATASPCARPPRPARRQRHALAPGLAAAGKEREHPIFYWAASAWS